MSEAKRILIIGTYDTKSDELSYIASCIESQGGVAVTMDVSVLGDPLFDVSYSKHSVAEAAGVSIQQVIDAGDENHAMQLIAKGASTLTA